MNDRSSLILKGDFKEVRIWNKARSCMVKLTLKIKDPHPFFDNNVVGFKQTRIEKDTIMRIKMDNYRWKSLDMEVKMTTDQWDLQLYDIEIVNNVLKVEIYNSVD
jgi:hypothetical protein